MKSQQIKIPNLKNPAIKKFLLRACEIEDASRLAITELQDFFNPSSLLSNPEEKDNETPTLKNVLSMKNLK